MFILPKDTEITLTVLQQFLDRHMTEVNNRYKKLHDAYKREHEILS